MQVSSIVVARTMSVNEERRSWGSCEQRWSRLNLFIQHSCSKLCNMTSLVVIHQ